ncbi:MAG TPA: hypothetical protein DCZ94_21855 [Lentisphaeria bacterium]|nr:MAG: hypothetical protein A2X48_19300 [Lentisphaerae bacterium GWF2_49_21]HBC89591.1 hypothetical protein [Lentisphaeria bacterium]
MKKYIITFAFLLALSLQAETYKEFLARFIPNKEIALPRAKNPKIRLEKIENEKIENITVIFYKRDGSIEQEITATKATISDLGNGKAELLLFDALIVATDEKGQNRKTTANQMSFKYEYQPVIIH